MKPLSPFGSCALFSLLLGSCTANKEADPIPVPPPNVIVHYKITGANKDVAATQETTSYAHSQPDSTYTYSRYTLGGNWEGFMPMRLPQQIDIQATLQFLTCNGVKQVLPPGGKVLVEITANGKVLKQMVLEAKDSPLVLPVANTIALSCAER